MQGQISAQLIPQGPTGCEIGWGRTGVPQESCFVRVDMLSMANKEAQEVTEARWARCAIHCKGKRVLSQGLSGNGS
jgi:hypothetical protein